MALGKLVLIALIVSPVSTRSSTISQPSPLFAMLDSFKTFTSPLVFDYRIKHKGID